MNNKILLFITISLVFIASLGIISATDINNTENTYTDTTIHQQDNIQTQSIETNNKTIQQKKSTKNIQKAENKNTKTEEKTVNSYSELYDEVTYAKQSLDSTYTINLAGKEQDYLITNKIEWESGLNVKTLTINGNGLTIDCDNDNQFFLVNDPELTLILNNITVVNGYHHLGTIQSVGTVIVNHSTFKNCNSESDNARAGAIYIRNGTLYTYDSVFKDSLSTRGTIALIHSAEANIINTSFINNTARNGGGAIYASAEEWDGSDYSTVYVNDSKFINNTSESSGGGAIYVYLSIMDIKNSEFIDNKETGFEFGGDEDEYPGGGAIYTYTYGDSYIKIKNSSFINNSATGKNGGGAIFKYAGALTIEESNFTDNKASRGGAISILYSSSIIEKCIFENNYASENAGSIYNNARLNISNSNFIKNTAENQGGAIYSNESSTITLKNNNFTENNANNGGSLLISTTSYTVIGNTFKDNLPETFDLMDFQGYDAVKIINDDGYIKDMEYSATVYKDGAISGSGSFYNGMLEQYFIEEKGHLYSFNMTSYDDSTKFKDNLYYYYIPPEIAISIDDVVVEYENNSFNIPVVFNKNVTEGTVTIKVNDVPIGSTTISEETDTVQVPVDISGLDINNYTMVAEYGIDSVLASDTAFLNITKIDTTTNIMDKSNVLGDVSITVNVTNKAGEIVKSGFIMVYDGNNNFIGASPISSEAVSIPLNIKEKGTYTINVTYTGNEIYNPSNITDTIKVVPEANIEVDILNNTQTNVTIRINATEKDGTPLKQVYINITLPNGNVITEKTDDNGIITVTDTTVEPGSRTVETEIKDNPDLKGTQKSKEFNVIPKEIERVATKIIVDALDTVVYNDSYKIKITVKEYPTEEGNNLPCNITLAINDETQIIELLTGERIISFTPTNVGVNSIFAYLKENQTHNSSINTTNFNVNKRLTQITPSQDTTDKENITINYNVDDIISETPIKEGTITVYDENNNIIKSAEFNKQTNTITITDLTPGEHTLTIVYDGNTTYNQSSKTLTVKQLPKANITIKVLNNTEGNVQIEYTVTNGTDPLTDSVTITLPNGTTTTKTPTSEGKIIITDTTTTPGNYTTTAKLETGDKYIGTSTTEDITIVPDYQKIIDELKETIQDMNNTIKEQEQTIKDMNNTIKDLNNTVQEQKQTIEDMNNTIKDMNNTIKDLNNTVQEQKQTIDNMNNTIKDMNNTIQEQKQTIKDMNNTIKDMNNTIQEQKQTIKDMNNTIKDMNNTVQEQKQTIENMNNTIKDLNKTVQEQNNTIKDLNSKLNESNKKINDLEKQNAELNKQLTELTSQVSTLTKTVNNLNNELADNQKTINTLNKTIVELDAIIKELTRKVDTKITVNKINTTTYSSAVTVTGTLTDKNGKALNNMPVSIKINTATTKVVTDSKGTYKYTGTAGTVGTNNVTVTFTDNDKYNSASAKTSFKVNKATPTLKINSISSVKFKDKVTVTGSLMDANNKAISTANITLKINNKTVTVKTGKDGLFTYTTTATSMGTNNVTATYNGNSKYNKATGKATFKVDKQKLVLTVDRLTSNIKYKDNIEISGKLVDGNGKAIGNTIVSVKVNSKTYKAKTDKYGIYVLKLRATEMGTNNITVSYAGNTRYDKASAKTTYNVEKQDIIIGFDTIKYSNGKVTIQGTFTDRNRHPLMNSVARITFNGKQGTAKTDNKGTFTYTTNANKGTYKVTLAYPGNARYNAYSKTTIVNTA